MVVRVRVSNRTSGAATATDGSAPGEARARCLTPFATCGLPETSSGPLPTLVT